MKEIYTEMIIHAPPAKVWSILMDFKSHTIWDPFIIRAEGVIEEGRSFQATLLLPDFYETRYRLKTIRLIPEREWIWLGSFLNTPWLLDGRHSFQLVDLGSRTRLIHKEQFTGVLVPLLWWFTSDQITKGIEMMNRALKNAVERTEDLQRETEVLMRFGETDPGALGRLRGSWALVTGASSGIGREFAQQLAAAGLNVVLVARREALLKSLAEELRRTHGVETQVCPMDLSKVGAAQRLYAAVRRKKVRIRLLCNVAGTGTWGEFKNTPLAENLAVLRLNTETRVALCQLFREDLMSHLTSGVINILSFAAYQPVPYMAVYSAAHAFVLNFSQSLFSEWLRQGVLVQTLVAPPTDTGSVIMQDVRIKRLFGKLDPPAKVVRTSLQHLAHRSPLVKTRGEPLLFHLFRIFFPEWAVILAVGQKFRPPDDRGKVAEKTRGRG